VERMRADKSSRKPRTPGQLTLAILLWVGEVTTSEGWGVNKHITQCTGPASVASQCKLMSG